LPHPQPARRLPGASRLSGGRRRRRPHPGVERQQGALPRPRAAGQGDRRAGGAHRVNVVHGGGDFGGKGDAVDLPIAHFLARQAGRPVRLLISYTEDLSASNPSHPTVVTIRSGVSRDGRLVARTARTIHASGAYAALKPNAALSTWHYVGGPYRVPHAA